MRHTFHQSSTLLEFQNNGPWGTCQYVAFHFQRNLCSNVISVYTTQQGKLMTKSVLMVQFTRQNFAYTRSVVFINTILLLLSYYTYVAPQASIKMFNMSWVSPFICTPCIPVYNRHINFIVSWARLTLSGRTWNLDLGPMPIFIIIT
jgi:hypothetical protein